MAMRVDLIKQNQALGKNLTLLFEYNGLVAYFNYYSEVFVGH